MSDVFDELMYKDFLERYEVKLQAQIFAREIASGTCEREQYVVQINFFTSYWVDGDFLQVDM